MTWKPKIKIGTGIPETAVGTAFTGVEFKDAEGRDCIIRTSGLEGDEYLEIGPKDNTFVINYADVKALINRLEEWRKIASFV